MQSALGDPAAVARAAAAIAAAASPLDALGNGLDDDLRATSWSGEAATAAAARVRAIGRSGGREGARLRAVGAALREYAEVLDREQSAAERARRDRVAAYAVLQRGLDLSACLGLLRAEGELRGARAAVAKAALTAAERIRAESEEPLRIPFTTQALDGASWHPRDVTQHGIGDCYLLSTLMGYMRTDAGDALLRSNLRWDEEAQGYWVTLYDEGEPVEYFVDWAYAGGATDPRAPELGIGVAAVYESAVGQHLGYADLADGGWPDDIMELLTGHRGTEYPTRQTWVPWDREYAADTVLGALEGGSSVTAETGATLATRVQYYEAGALVTDEFAIVGNHSYMVVGVDDDGSVVLRNPWGDTDTVDGSTGLPTDGGRVFRVSEEDFRRVFQQVTVSAPAGAR